MILLSLIVLSTETITHDESTVENIERKVDDIENRSVKGLSKTRKNIVQSRLTFLTLFCMRSRAYS